MKFTQPLRDYGHDWNLLKQYDIHYKKTSFQNYKFISLNLRTAQAGLGRDVWKRLPISQPAIWLDYYYDLRIPRSLLHIFGMPNINELTEHRMHWAPLAPPLLRHCSKVCTLLQCCWLTIGRPNIYHNHSHYINDL